MPPNKQKRLRTQTRYRGIWRLLYWFIYKLKASSLL